MFFGLPDDAVALREGLRELLARTCTPATIRAAWDGDPCEALWKTLGQYGVLGLLVPESDGGLGLDERLAPVRRFGLRGDHVNRRQRADFDALLVVLHQAIREIELSLCRFDGLNREHEIPVRVAHVGFGRERRRRQ